MEELAILLEASEPRLNRHRFWLADVGRDLFGDWRTDIVFGRIGSRGRTLSYGFTTRQEAKAFLEAALKRRRGALRRCGVAYCLVESITGPDGPSDGDIRALISGTGLARTKSLCMAARKLQQNPNAKHTAISTKTRDEPSLLLDQDVCRGKAPKMCNLYSETKNQDAIRALFRVAHDRTGKLPSFPGIFPARMTWRQEPMHCSGHFVL